MWKQGSHGYVQVAADTCVRVCVCMGGEKGGRKEGKNGEGGQRGDGRQML